MLAELKAVRAAISDCKTLPGDAFDLEWETQCQIVMKADITIDMREVRRIQTVHLRNDLFLL